MVAKRIDSQYMSPDRRLVEDQNRSGKEEMRKRQETW